MIDQRKSITPVIAIVLLLMVTVGAVGVVYSQFQSFVGDPTEQINSQRRNQNTDISIIKGRSNDTSDPDSGQMILEVQNTGSVTRNTSAFRLITDDPSMVPGDGGMVDGYLSTNPKNSTLLDPEETMDFYTGIPFPGPTDGVVVTLNLKGSVKTFNINCRPITSSTAFCQ